MQRVLLPLALVLAAQLPAADESPSLGEVEGLPPKIVRRDVARGEPRHWHAEAVIDGRTQPAARARFSSSLSTSESRRNFVQVADVAATVNDGILQPQYLTPFAMRPAQATPTFIRREPDR